jgi:bifunctional non-homologous end joining protein LigD
VLREALTFIRPMSPTVAKEPPVGHDWIHEVKFDGWRVQVHVNQGDVAIYSKNGADFTKHFSVLQPALPISHHRQRARRL